MASGIKPKYLFANEADFTKSWPLPEGYYMAIYYVTADDPNTLIEQSFMNVKISKADFAFYDSKGALLKAQPLTAAKDYLLSIMQSEGSQFGFVTLAKDPVGTVGQALTPTPAYLAEQGQAAVYTYQSESELLNPALFPPPDGDYKADFYDKSSMPNPTPVATTVYTVKNKGFTEYKIDSGGNLVSSASVTTDSVKQAILAQTSKGGKVVFTTIKLTTTTEGDEKAKSGMPTWMVAALVAGGIYLLTRKKGQ